MKKKYSKDKLPVKILKTNTTFNEELLASIGKFKSKKKAVKKD
jgi:hypothetical protein